MGKTPVEVEALVEGRELPREPRWLGSPVRLIDCRGKLDIRSHARNAHTRAVRYLRPARDRQVKAMRMVRFDNGGRRGPQLRSGRADFVRPARLECKPEGKPSNERRDPAKDEAHSDVDQEFPRPIAVPLTKGQRAPRSPFDHRKKQNIAAKSSGDGASQSNPRGFADPAGAHAQPFADRRQTHPLAWQS